MVVVRGYVPGVGVDVVVRRVVGGGFEFCIRDSGVCEIILLKDKGGDYLQPQKPQ